MLMKTFISLFAALLFTFFYIPAQTIVGFWEVTKVQAGGQTMTPVSKWTKINKDGSYQSGNGWLQNAEGNWTYDDDKNLFSPVESNGVKDNFGPFTVEFNADTMTWLREEEGMIVTVSLKKITKKPKATADQLVGLWDLNTITKEGKSTLELFDPNNKYYVFIRWDRVYMERMPNGNRSTGYWHIHAHKPEITLLSHDKKKPDETWLVAISAKELKMSGISNTNKGIEMSFKRIHEFPK